ncbi:hypothetical protein FSP39_022073 [Pinctada imbricata]|uniref:Uncharacterized protein n=1 Tax=Pinctada imbricata TaxID=66713 RepID=A0AA88Y103_PINIB|nr:hypothetical protein FSP39_022073 [Pinctada imbricata]
MEKSEEEESAEKIILSKSYEKRPSRSGSKGSKSPSAKRKSKISNWSKIIKVLTRQKADDMGVSVRTKKDFPSSSTTPSSSSAKELTVPSSSAVDGKSVDSGMGSGLEAEGPEGQRKSTSSGEPISPESHSPSHDDTNRMDELTSEIWIGPPEWVQEHEDELATPTSCLEHKEIIVLKPQASKDQDYLRVHLPRRKSSPSLHDHEDKLSDSSDGESYSPLRRSSSCKEQMVTSDDVKEQLLGSPKGGKKLQHSTISKMIKMVHTRKDSIKKKLKKSSPRTEFEHQSGEELSEADMEGYEDVYEDEEGPLGRSTPKTSPTSVRQHQPSRSEGRTAATMLSQLGGSIDVSALMGGMSDEFSRKWKQWEELQTKRLSSPQKADSSEYSESIPTDSIGTVSPEFQKKMEEWERSKSIKVKPLDEPPSKDSREGSPEGFTTPPDGQNQPINIEEIQKKLTDSFSRKMEEWEKRKYRREGSPAMDRKDSSSKLISRKDDRQKSKRSKEEKDREKLEKQRERELQRVEREQHKLEKEKLRLEKERLKALEREARLEKMKGRLSQPDMESKFKNPILSPLAEYKMTSTFAKKLHEWEARRGQSSSVSMATYLETQQRSLEAGDFSPPKGKIEFSLEDPSPPGPSTGTKLAKGQKPPPLTLMPCTDSPEEVSPGARSRSSLDSFGEDTSVTMESMTEANISRLEKANARLLEELNEKETEYASLQVEVEDLTNKLNKARIQHSKDMERYKRECLTGGTIPPSSPVSMGSELTDLEDKIQDLKYIGENLAESMESAAVCKMQSVEGEDSVNTQLMELLEKMRVMLLRASQSEEIYQKSSALHSFEKLYSQAMQLQVQLSNLRLSQIERNKEIMSMKRQLLLQEANNLLLQADITRRETELIRYKHYAKGTSAIKRWNTYGGMEGRVVESETTECVPPYKRFTKGLKAEQQSALKVVDEPTEQVVIQEVKSAAEESLTDISKPSTHSSPALSNAIEHLIEEPQYTVQSLEDQQTETASEVDYIAKQLEEPETHESTIVMQGQREEDLTIHGEKGVEIALMIKLPTASVSLPKDLSQQELSVPRSQRFTESDGSSSQLSTTSSKSEAKFPELLIPEWKRSAGKGRLLKIQSIDVDDPEEKAQSDSAILCKTERTFQPTMASNTESPHYIVTFPEDQIKEEKVYKTAHLPSRIRCADGDNHSH